MSHTGNTGNLSFRFEFDEAGRKMFVLTYGGEKFSNLYEKECFYNYVNGMMLRTKERAALLYAAADYSPDEAERKWLMDKAKVLATDGDQIEHDCAQSNIPLAQVCAANVSGPVLVEGRPNEGSQVLPPFVTNVFAPVKAFEISKQCKEEMVCAMEGRFVSYYQGELALTALGLLDGRPLNYVTWIDKMFTLTTTVQFLLGLKTLKLQEEKTVECFTLPAGLYGNGNKLVVTRGGGDNHWPVVVAHFQNRNGEAYNSASLRSTASRLPNTYQDDYAQILYVFRHLIFEPNSCIPLQNGLYRAG